MIDLKSLNENLMKLQKDFTNAIHEREYLTNEISKLNKEKENLNQQLVQLNEKQNSIQNPIKFDKFGKEIESVNQQIANIDAKIENYKSANTPNLETLNEQISNMFNSYNDLVTNSKSEIKTEIQSEPAGDRRRQK